MSILALILMGVGGLGTAVFLVYAGSTALLSEILEPDGRSKAIRVLDFLMWFPVILLVGVIIFFI